MTKTSGPREKNQSRWPALLAAIRGCGKSLGFFAVVLAPVAAAFAPVPSQACGAMLFSDHVVRSGGMFHQQILYVFGEQAHIVALSAAYSEDDGSDAAFLLPIRLAPDEVSESDPALFGAIDQGTAPRFFIKNIDDEPSGCEGATGRDKAAGGAGDALADGGGVDIVDEGMTDSYTYAVIGGDTGDDLASWLTSAGFDVPESFAQVVQPYADSGWLFLAAKMRVDAEPRAFAPLVLRFPASAPTSSVVPLGLGRDSLPPGGELGISLYVASSETHGWVPKGQPLAELDSTQLKATSAFETNYTEVFAKAVGSDEAGAWVSEYRNSVPSFLDDVRYPNDDRREESSPPRSSSSGGNAAGELFELAGLAAGMVTRSRTSLGAGQLIDVGLMPHGDEGSVYSIRERLEYSEHGDGCRLAERVGGWAWLGLLPLWWSRRRRE